MIYLIKGRKYKEKSGLTKEGKVNVHMTGQSSSSWQLTVSKERLSSMVTEIK